MDQKNKETNKKTICKVSLHLHNEPRLASLHPPQPKYATIPLYFMVAVEIDPPFLRLDAIVLVHSHVVGSFSSFSSFSSRCQLSGWTQCFTSLAAVLVEFGTYFSGCQHTHPVFGIVLVVGWSFLCAFCVLFFGFEFLFVSVFIAAALDVCILLRTHCTPLRGVKWWRWVSDKLSSASTAIFRVDNCSGGVASTAERVFGELRHSEKPSYYNRNFLWALSRKNAFLTNFKQITKINKL